MLLLLTVFSSTPVRSEDQQLGLSPLLIKEVSSIIKNIAARGVTVLLVAQNARLALGLADYGYVFATGEVVLEGRRSSWLTTGMCRRPILAVEIDRGRSGLLSGRCL